MSEVARVLGGRYAVGPLLGRGGMADVHTGHDQRLDRRVAIKLLRSDVARDPVFQARFRREAQSTACLNHPAVVSVYDTGEDVSTDGSGAQVRTPFIVMEHVEGRTVRDVLDDAAAAGRRGLGTQRAVEITAGVLAALQAAHDAGIVHRDVKPANVMVTPSGGVKVMDFGIARALADSSVTMTQTSVVIGTARYLSPEQARGEAVDARTDLYSTGCLLYELLTGRPPFLGDSPLSVVYQHVGELPTPPSAHQPAVGDQLDAVVLTALSKHREDRHADALAFRDALLAALAGTGPTSTGPTRAVAADRTGRMPVQSSPRRGRRRAAAVVVSTLAVVLALGGWLPGGATQESPGTAAAGTAGSAASTGVPSARAATGTPVVLTAASVPREATVPPLVGSSQEQAAAALAAAGLELGAVTPQDVGKSTAGTVVSSTPAQGTAAAAGSSVALVVASGRVALDDYTGQTQVGAAQALEDLGLTVTTTPEPSDRPAGEVLRQSEAAGTRVAVGSAVALAVSSGPVATTTTTTTAAPPSAAPAAPPTEGSTGASSSSWGGATAAPASGDGAGRGAGQQPSADQGSGQGKEQDPSPGGAQQPAPGPGSDASKDKGTSDGQGRGQGQGQGKAVGQGSGQGPGQSAGQSAGQPAGKGPARGRDG